MYLHQHNITIINLSQLRYVVERIHELKYVVEVENEEKSHQQPPDKVLPRHDPLSLEEYHHMEGDKSHLHNIDSNDVWDGFKLVLHFESLLVHLLSLAFLSFL